MIKCANREMFFIHFSQIDLLLGMNREKENKSYSLQPGNTLYISEVSSSIDGCQLGKHLSTLPVCACSSQQSWSYTPMVSDLNNTISQKLFKLWAGQLLCL